MRLVSYTYNGAARFGAVTDDDAVVDLARRMPDIADVRTLLDAGALDRAAELAAGADADHALGELSLDRPVTFPEKIFCIGVNYMNRNAEYRDESAAPRHPSVFVRMPDTLVGHGQPIVRPPESEQLDYEGEIAIVIGRAGRRIAEADAGSHIAGITCMNEGSVRDWLRHGKFNVTQGKNFVGSGALGPWLTTADEVADFDALTVTTHVNGEQRQHDTTGNLAFPFRHLVAYLSSFALLKPGDVIATGTPVGAGARFEPPRWLVPGDRVDVTVAGVGTLSNVVADEDTS